MSDDGPPAAAPAGGVCPFRGVMQRVGLSPRGTGDAKEAAPPGGVCPFSGAKSSGGVGDGSTATTTTEPSPSASGGGVCPLGFGRSKPGGPPLSRLHCPRCKSLFQDCVLLGCGHRFCSSCLGGGGGGGEAGGAGAAGGAGEERRRHRWQAPMQRSRSSLAIVASDCLVCGADISSRSRDAESQALADAALEDAARADREGQAQAWLRAAMSSAAGGNHAAALARAERAAAALEEELASPSSSLSASSPSAAAAAAVRRASVCGVIGDSHRSLGDLESAAQKYESAVAVLERALAEGGGEAGAPAASSSSSSSSSSSRELTRALTVTLNKLGDLRYSSASAGEARPFYARALRERLAAAGVGEAQAREAASASASGSESDAATVAIPPAGERDAELASDLVDAGLSAAKVADADAAAGAAEAAAGGLRLAAALLAAGAAGAAAAGGPLAARAERLRAFLKGK